MGASFSPLVMLVLAAALHASGVANAAKCTVSQADISKTPFSLEPSSTKAWQLTTGRKTAFQQFCFKLSDQAKRAINGTAKTCTEAGHGPAQCCATSSDPRAPFRPATVRFFTGSSCSADSKGLAAFRKAWWTTDPSAQKKGPQVSGAYKKATSTIQAGWEVKIKPRTPIGAGQDLCINIPQDAANPCKTANQAFGGAQAKVELATTKFKPPGDKKWSYCCVASSAATYLCNPPCVNGGVCSASNTCTCPLGFNGSTCATPVPPPQSDTRSMAIILQVNGSSCPNQTDLDAMKFLMLQALNVFCFLVCANGKCNLPSNTCDCAGTGLTGPTCTTPVCNPACKNNGKCLVGNTCDCSGTGYKGPTCEILDLANATSTTQTFTAQITGSCPSTGDIDVLGAGISDLIENYLEVDYTINSTSCKNITQPIQGAAIEFVITLETEMPEDLKYALETVEDIIRRGSLLDELNGLQEGLSWLDETADSFCLGLVCYPVCKPGCSHGTCATLGNGTHACDCTGSGYTGELCEDAICNPACTGGSTCYFPGVCTSELMITIPLDTEEDGCDSGYNGIVIDLMTTSLKARGGSDLMLYSAPCYAEDVPGAGKVALVTIYATFSFPAGNSLGAVVRAAINTTTNMVNMDCVYNGPTQQTGSICTAFPSANGTANLCAAFTAHADYKPGAKWILCQAAPTGLNMISQTIYTPPESDTIFACNENITEPLRSLMQASLSARPGVITAHVPSPWCEVINTAMYYFSGSYLGPSSLVDEIEAAVAGSNVTETTGGVCSAYPNASGTNNICAALKLVAPDHPIIGPPLQDAK
ncbi:MAG: hypothetical protein J3K34DRAFT_522896 [Monoraphidium minutum]|nr:MAG: hypothetical protein J3K34DRAFT_522896 [Monoraphidium minutum]